MGDTKDDKDDKETLETDPALPSDGPNERPAGDQISRVIGDVGRWQIEKILLVFLASAPGLRN